jgi:hypothetical protein
MAGRIMSALIVTCLKHPSQAERRMMKEIEEMSSDSDDDSGSHVEMGNSRSKRAAKSDIRATGSSKRARTRPGTGSAFASADDFGAEVDDWHAQLVEVPPHGRAFVL